MSKTLTLVFTAVSASAMSIALLAQSSSSPTDPGMSPGTVPGDQRQTSRPTMPERPTTSDQSSPQREQEQPAEQTQQSGQRRQAASVLAELTKRIDSKNAKVGDTVNAKTTTATKLPDGTDLPKGTTLVGKITDVQAKAKGANDARLAFSVEKAVLKDGKEVPLRAAVASMTAPASSNSGAADVGMRSSPVPSGGDSSGAGGSSASASGGLPSSAGSMPVATSDTSSQPTQGGTLKSSEDQVAVGNLPGVMLTGSNKPDSSGTLIASGKNISLDSGTKMIIYLAVAG